MFPWQPGAFVKEPALCVSLWEVSHRDSPCSKELTDYRNPAGETWKWDVWIRGNSAGCALCCEYIQRWMFTHRGTGVDQGVMGPLLLGNWQMWHVVQVQELFVTGIIFPGRADVSPRPSVKFKDGMLKEGLKPRRHQHSFWLRVCLTFIKFMKMTVVILKNMLFLAECFLCWTFLNL